MKKLIIAGLLMSILAGCSKNTREQNESAADRNSSTGSGAVTLKTDEMVRTEAFKDVVRYQQQIVEISIEYANWKAEHPRVKLLTSDVDAKINEISIKRTQMTSAELRKAHEDALVRSMRDI